MAFRYRRFSVLLAVLLSASAALIIAITVWFTLAERGQMLSEARGQTATLARALEEHIRRAMDATRLLMLDAGESIEARGGLRNLNKRQVREILLNHLSRVRDVRALYVYGSDLRLFATTTRPDAPPIDGARYGYIAAHGRARTDGMVIGDTIAGPFSGHYNVAASARLDRPDGTLDGVLGVVIDARYFERFYRSLALPADAELTLLRDDGGVLFRFPVERFRLGQNWNDSALFGFIRAHDTAHGGLLSMTLPGEHSARLIAFRHLSELPLVVLVSRDEKALLTDWWAVVAFRGLLVGAGLLLLSALGVALARQAEQRRVAEARDRATFEQAAVGIAHAAPDGRWLRVNRRLCEITGYGADELSLLNLDDLVHPEDLDADRALRERMLAGELPSTSNEVRCIRRDGAQRWVNVTHAAVRDGSGRPEYVVTVVEDVDARRTADIALEEHRARLSEAQRMAQLGSWDLDVKTGSLVWSDEIYRICEVDPSEFTPSYDAFLAIVHPGDRVRIDTAYRESISSRKPYEITHRLRMADGRIKYVVERGQTDCDADGTPRRSMGTVQDVTDRVQRERAAAVKDAAIESAITPFVMSDAEGRITYANPAYVRMRGYRDASQVVGHLASEFSDPPEQVDRIFEVLHKRGEWAGQLVGRRPNGERRILGVSASVVRGDDGEIMATMASFVDVTDRDAAERELERLNATLERRVIERTQELADERNFIGTVLDTVRALVIVLDAQGRVVEFNRACQTLTGYTLDDMRGEVPWRRLVPPEQRDAVQRAFANVVAAPGTSEFENDWIASNGEPRWIAWSINVIMDEGGRLQYVIGTGIDITERRQAQRALVEARDAAERANAAKSMFLSRMSHELRSPLHAILGFAQVMALEAKRLTAKDRGTLDRIQRAGWHLLSLINDVLDLSSIESGEQPIRLVAVNLAKVIDECVNMTRSQADAVSVGIVVSNAARRGFRVMADVTRLKQVIANLLSNGIKYNRTRGRIRIDASALDDGRVRLEFADTGIGMDADQLERLFEPFNRLGAERLGVEGTGIGLVIAKRLIEAMGGSMTVSSRPGQGSTFVVFLRRSPSAEDDERPARDGARATGTERRRAPRRATNATILYAEDDPAGAELMRRLVARRDDIRLVVAQDGAEAVDLARRYRPTLAILDMNLPDMDGHELLRRLRTLGETRDIPVVALSANAFDADVGRARYGGFADYVTKPVRVEDLLARLEKLIEGAAVQQG